MIAALMHSMLAVMLLLDPMEEVDGRLAEAVSKDADRVELAGGEKVVNDVTHARIRSVSSEFDRLAGVMLFEGQVEVDYGEDYTMCADRVYAFLAGSNELSRVVAIGNVAITNETRVGRCETAIYRRRKGEIVMFGEGAEGLASLVESGDDASELTGSRIRFWLDSEQVEVENSRIAVEDGGMEEDL